MNSLGRFSARAFWGLASWLLPLIVVFLLTPRLLHLLGPERFGILMILLVTPVIATQFDFGLALSAVRQFAADFEASADRWKRHPLFLHFGFLRSRLAVRHDRGGCIGMACG